MPRKWALFGVGAISGRVADDPGRYARWMTSHSVETTTHGRVLVENAADPHSGRLLIACHRYAQNAEAMLEEVRRIPGVAGWRVASVQALHRFYSRGQQTVVASWMTRED